MNSTKLSYFFKKHKLQIAVFLSLAMVYGFMAGRAILSSAMFLFFVNAVWDTKPKLWTKNRWWIFGLVWVGLYAFSFFWSEDIPYWKERFEVKYALVIFPLAMAMLPKLTPKLLKAFTWGLAILAISGCIYSLHFYFQDKEQIINDYFKSKVFKTPAYKDHIRFSIFIAWVATWCMYMFGKMKNKIAQIMIATITLFLILYLHILAVRSGLLYLYSFSFVYVIFLFVRKKILLGTSIVLGISLSFAILFNYTPSFREKIYYGIHSIKEYQKGNETVDYSDIGRLVSYKLATKIIVEHPLLGVGSGDVRGEMKKKYEHYYPYIRPEQMIVPHNQFLEVMLAGGIVTLVFFVIWLFYPILSLKKTRGGFFIFATWFGLLMCIMVEAMLEVQFGVFVFLFGILWILKAVESETATPIDSDPTFA